MSDEEDVNSTWNVSAPPAAGDQPALPETRQAFADPKPTQKPTIPDVKILDILGRGGMGVVFRGHQQFLGRDVAVKCLEVEHGQAAAEFGARFRREATILAELEHENIVRCHHAGFAQAGEPYLLMELVEGPNLQQFIDRKGALPEAAALRLGRDVARALKYALEKSRMIHRDIKPGNILLKPIPGAAEEDLFPYTPKLADLGLARCQDNRNSEGSVTQSGVVMGTPSMMAPEQIDSPKDVDFPADIYSLGCVLFEALTGRAAFNQDTLSKIIEAKLRAQPPNPVELAPTVRKETCALILQMMDNRADLRPASYDEIIQRIDAIIEGRPLPAAARVPAAAPPSMSTKRGTQAFFWIGSAFALVAAAAIALFMRPDGFAKGASPQKSEVAPPPAPALSIPRQEQPAAPALSAIEWGEPKALLHSALGDRLKDWSPANPNKWAPDENGEGIKCSLCALDDLLTYAPSLGAPWRISGEIDLADATEVGARVGLADGRAARLRLQNLGGTILARIDWAHAEGSEPSGERLPTPEFKDLDIASGSGVAFSVAAGNGAVEFEVEGKSVSIPASSPVETLSLHAEGPRELLKRPPVFKNLMLHRPKE